MKISNSKKANLQANLTISRVNSSKTEDYISIVLNDKNSNNTVVEVEIDFKSFAEAITGLGFQDCSYTIFDNYENLGKTKEVKSEVIEFPNYADLTYYDKEVSLRFTVEGLKVYEFLVSPYETDGWKADINSVLKTRGGCVGTTAIKSVVFTRYM